MNTDLSILHLVQEASVVVQFVLFILLAASIASWTFIFSKRKELKQAIDITDDFEQSSGQAWGWQNCTKKWPATDSTRKG